MSGSLRAVRGVLRTRGTTVDAALAAARACGHPPLGAVLATRGAGLPDVDVLVEDADDGDLAQVTGRLRNTDALRQVVVRRCPSG